MTPDELQAARQFRAERESLIQNHLRAQTGQDAREAEHQRQVQEARAASVARAASYQEAQAQERAARAAREAEREAQRAQLAAMRSQPRGTVTRLTDAHPPHREENRTEAAAIAVFGHPLSDFVLRHLPPTDPKVKLFKQYLMNGVPQEGENNG